MKNIYCEIIIDIDARKITDVYTYKVPVALIDKISLGDIVKIPFGRGNREIKGYVVALESEVLNNKIKYKEIIEIINDQMKPDAKILELLYWMKNRYFLPLNSVLKLGYFKTSTSRIKKQDFDLEINPDISVEKMRKSKKKDILKLLILEGKIPFNTIKDNFGSSNINLLIKEKKVILVKKKHESNLKSLNLEQKIAYESIKKQNITNSNNKTLLFGTTGSGKTEIYFYLIKDVLDRNKQVLVLVPEINLTEQLIMRFEEAFPRNVVRWHSKVGAAEKNKSLEEISKGEKNIILGSRSSIFVSIKKLGLIIIDEEHDMSYQQTSMPIYHAREVATRRSEIENVPIVYGSGTPGIETFYQCEKGNYNLIEVKSQYHTRGEEEFNVISMSDELRNGNYTFLSNDLKQGIIDTLKGEHKVILYLNRRGYYNFLLCRDCGYTPKCENCDVTLTYHEGNGELKCHYCNRVYENLIECPVCKSKRIKGLGLGTEQVVEYFKDKFPEYTIERLDSDLQGGNSRKKEIIKKFEKGYIDILVGTQIIGKGIDFPNVGLVGILLGDSNLKIPDYRAREWMYQRILQVIGRSGRRGQKNLIFLQTYRNSDIINDRLRNKDYKGLYEDEIKYRRPLGYPPFGNIYRIQLIGKNEDILQKKGMEIVFGIQEEKFNWKIYGPQKNSIGKIKGQYRYNILIKGASEEDDEITVFLNKFYEKQIKIIKDIFIYIERNPGGYI